MQDTFMTDKEQDLGIGVGTSVGVKRYKTIYADPPWLELGGGRIKRGADKHYPLMKTEDIKNLRINDVPIKLLSEDSANLYLWTTNNFLKDALEVMESWGFEYITNIAWCKDRFGLGYYFRGQHELLLFGVKGKNRLPKHKIKTDGLWSTTPQKENTITPTTVIHAKRSEHSKKPDEFYNLIETVSYEPYLEIFARRQKDGWDSWGNEI